MLEASVLRHFNTLLKKEIPVPIINSHERGSLCSTNWREMTLPSVGCLGLYAIRTEGPLKKSVDFRHSRDLSRCRRRQTGECIVPKFHC